MSRLLFEGSHGLSANKKEEKSASNDNTVYAKFGPRAVCRSNRLCYYGELENKELRNAKLPRSEKNDVFQPNCKRINYVFVFLQDHLENCSKFPLPCPNDCGDSVLREMVTAFHFSMGDFTDGTVKYLRTMQLCFSSCLKKKLNLSPVFYETTKAS